MLEIILLLLLVLALSGATVLGLRLRKPGPVMWQFGHFVNTRPGLQERGLPVDEPEIVEYDDYRYWIRVRPNPGVNLPLLGYYSRQKGRR